MLLISPSAHFTANETPSDLRGRSLVSHLQFFLSFSYSCKRLTSSSSNLILRVFAYAKCVCNDHEESFCVCVHLSGGCSYGGIPSPGVAFRPKPGRFPPSKINVCASICMPVCVCQGFVRQISPACSALVLLNQASITRPLWIMQGRLLLTYSTICFARVCVRLCLCVCVCALARVCDRMVLFPLCKCNRAVLRCSSTWPLNLVSDTETPTLILSLWVCALCVSASLYAGGFYSRQEELNSSRQLRPAVWHTLTHYIQPANSGVLSLK